MTAVLTSDWSRSGRSTRTLFESSAGCVEVARQSAVYGSARFLAKQHSHGSCHRWLQQYNTINSVIAVFTVHGKRVITNIYVQSSASQSSKLMVMENVNFYKMTQTLSDLMLSDFVKTKFVFSKLLNETLNHQQNYKIVLLHSPQI